MLSTYRTLLSRYRNYVWAAALLLSLGILLGVLATLYYPQTIEKVFQMVGEELQRLGKDVLSSPLGQGILILFWHNLQALLLITVLGLALGVYPAFAMLFNGLIIGVVGALSVQNSSLAVFIAGILPHGIFEIPALIIGAAIGLRVGIGPLVARPRRPFASPSDRTWRGYGQELHDAMILLSFCTILLTVAAIIEVSVTPRVMGLFR